MSTVENTEEGFLAPVPVRTRAVTLLVLVGVNLKGENVGWIWVPLGWIGGLCLDA